MALVAGLLAVAQASAGQTPGTGATSPLLPPRHWAVDAAARVEAMGLAPGYLPAQAAVPRTLVAAALREAAERVKSENPAWSLLIEGWLSRLVEEFPDLGDRASPGGGIRLLGSKAAVGGQFSRGTAGPGTHLLPEERTGATALPDRTGVRSGLDLAIGLGTTGAVWIRPAVGSDGFTIDGAEAVLRWGSLRASIGRAEVGWGTGVGGGTILGGAQLDRVELSTVAPLRLPGPLGLLGPFAIHTFVSRLPEDRHPGGPVLMGTTASARPHPRFTISAHRALMVGGTAVEQKMGVDEIIPALIGKNVPGADQIASTSLSLRIPTEAWIPFSVYCEWGAEDSAGAPFESPGLICGGVSPALPGAPGVSAGIEHAQFGAAPVNGPPWYRHLNFPGGWALDEAPLGHPLGGEGKQWLLHSNLSGFESRLEVEVRAFRRERRGDNLFMPGRPGESTGFSASARWRYTPRAEVLLSSSIERGAGWREHGASALWQVLF